MRYSINLFPPKKHSLIDRALYFALHYLRYVIVITQIIVIGVFFYRFRIDQEVVDVKDTINQKQEIITISAPLVQEVRAIESKGKQIDTILTKQNQFQSSLSYMLSIFPEKLSLDKFNLTEDGTIEMSGTTTDPNIVRIFYNRLKKDNKFTGIDLKDIKKTLLGYQFSFLLTNLPQKK